MTRIEKIENIMKSNLSDEMKEEFVKLLFEKNEQPAFVPYPSPYFEDPKPWWQRITC
jgi:hypothetical protein